MDKNLRGYLAELVGTFAVVLLAAGAVCTDQTALLTGGGSPRPGLVGIALAYGLAYGVALAAVLPLSGGYLNPAITLMLWVFKRLDGVKTMALVFVQLLGAALAGGLIRLVYTPLVLTDARMGTPHLNLQGFGLYPDLRGLPSPTAGTLLKGVALETGFTFILGFVLFATIVDPRVPRMLGAWGRRLTGLWMGLLVVAITLVGFGMTGAAVNPARWFGTVIWEPTVPLVAPYADHMVYWFGPVAGALLAGVFYTTLILPAEAEHVAAPVAAPGTKAAAATLFRSKK